MVTTGTTLCVCKFGVARGFECLKTVEKSADFR